MRTVVTLFVFCFLQSSFYINEHPNFPKDKNSITHFDSSAPCLFENFGTLSGNTGSATPFEVQNFCGAIENNLFIPFTAFAPTIIFSVTVSNCNQPPPPNGAGLQGIVYDITNDFTVFTPVSNCSSEGMVTPFDLVATNLVIGNIYYLMIDGWAGDVCDFQVDISQPDPVDCDVVLPIPDTPVQTGGTICLSDLNITTLSFATNSPPNNLVNYWTAEPNGTITNGIFNNEVSVEFNSPGLKTVCTQSYDGCLTSEQICIDVEIFTPSVTLETINFCSPETAVCGGQQIIPTPTQDTLIEITLQGFNGCDSIIICQMNIADPPPTVLDVVTCSGSDYQVCGTNVSEAGTYEFECISYLGCDSTILLELTTIPEDSTFISEVICLNDSFNFAGIILDSAGMYQQNFQDATTGCDSLVFLNLSILPSDTTIISTQICQNDSLFFNSQQLSTTGIYIDTLTASTGCDSFIILELQVASPDSTYLTASICEGQSFSFDTLNLTLAGTYFQNLTNVQGCDSLLILNLELLENDSTFLQQSLCTGDTFSLNGMEYVESGNYTQNFSNQNNCDSVLVINLLFLETYVITIDTAICENELLLYNGVEYSEAGIYDQSLISQNGCDSILSINLSVNSTFSDTLHVEIAEGEVFEIGNSTYNQTGLYQENFQSVFDCDSIVFVDLLVLSCPTEFCNGSIVAGDSPQEACIICNLQDLHSYEGSTQGFNPTLIPEEFCTGVISIENNQFIAFLAPQNEVSFKITPANCQGGVGIQAQILATTDCNTDWTAISDCEAPGTQAPIEVSATDLIIGELYYLIIDGWAGDVCDFTIEITNPFQGGNLPSTEILQTGPNCLFADSTVLTFSVPEGNDFFDFSWSIDGGNLLTTNDSNEIEVSYDNVGTATVCVTVSSECANYPQICTEVELTDAYEVHENVTLCSEANELFCAGNPITPLPTIDTTYQFAFVASNGCDSTLFCHIELVEIDTQFVEIAGCENTIVELCTINVLDPGIYTQVCESWQGCDSVVVSNVNFFPTFQESITLEICAGDSLQFGGQTFIDEGFYQLNFQSQNGCDSTILLTLNYDNSSFLLTTEICPNDSVIVGNSSYSEAGFYIDTLTSFLGCDSIVQLDLTVSPDLILVDENVVGTIPTEENGVIALQFESDATPLSFAWSNGETTQNIFNLSAGEYVLTVTDANGCEFEFDFVVPIILNAKEEAVAHQFQLLPNPVANHNSLTILHQNTISIEWQIQLFEVTGRLISEQKTKFWNGKHQLEMPKTAGIYWLVLTSEKGTFSEKIVVY